MSLWLLVPVAFLALGLVIEVRRYRNMYKRASAQLRASERRARHQERLAQRAAFAQARTGHVDAAPVACPVVYLHGGVVLDFPDRNGNQAA